uniref:VWFC domain-containing protein n=1 Tax=Anolis carolinensis TaxID=28377 RepID=A0A803STY5_ANOCA
RPLSCVWEGRRYEDGASWEKDACAGTVQCQATKCPELSCRERYTPPGECCPVCRPGKSRNIELCLENTFIRQCMCICLSWDVNASCNNSNSDLLLYTTGCMDGASRYEHNEEWTPATDPCLKCRCQEGNSVCKRRHCAILCRSPARPRPGTCCPVCDGESHRKKLVGREAGEVTCENLFADCPPLSCSHPARRPGQCCPTCEGVDSSWGPMQLLNARLNIHINLSLLPSGLCPVCILDSIEFEDGTEWEPEGEPCRTCVCHQGEPVCSAVQCPPVPCQHPAQLQGACCPECQRCSYNQRLYNNGQEFLDPDNLCQSCQCADGTVSCSPIVCPPATCPRPQKKPGSCCAKCPDCTYENRIIADGEEVPSPLHPCQACICTGGEMRCMERQCPGALCAHPLLGSCCQNNCNGCNYAGKEYPNGAEFPHPTDKCRKCHCINGNVQCLTRRCLPLPCPEPFSVPGECCPRCPAPPATCVYLGLSYQHMERFYDPSDKCRDCICTNGTITCQRQPCVPVQCSHPLRHDCCLSCDGCLYQGKELPNGEQFADPQDPCGTCSCWEGSVTCKATPCPPPECPFPTSGPCCKVCEDCDNGELFLDPRDPCGQCKCSGGTVTCVPAPCPPISCQNPITLPGQCCPKCTGACRYHGQLYKSGEAFVSPEEACHTCTCQAEVVTCQPKPCPQKCTHPEAPKAPSCCPSCDGCLYKEHSYANGQTFTPPSDPCKRCSCLHGNVLCAPVVCPQVPCANPRHEPGQCCPQCPGCTYEGRERPDGSSWLSLAVPCMACMCVDGVATCAEIACIRSCTNQINVPGECCPLCADCIYEGLVYGPGESFQPGKDPCEICTCEVMSDGEQHLQCYRKQCPSLLDCPREQIQVPGPGHCCPTCAQALSNCTPSLVGNEVLATDEPCYSCQCKDLTWVCMHQSCPLLSCPAAERFVPRDACCPVCDGEVYLLSFP